MGVNYALGTVVGTPTKGAQSDQSQKVFLTFGVALNLAALAYYKYWFFITENITLASGYEFSTSNIVLPLAISFFTFQQIAFLVDRYRSHISMPKFIDYLFFVTFFPQLIAGPIVLSKEIFPQLKEKIWRKPNWFDVSIGLTLFSLGVFKKILFGDHLGDIADQIFGAASTEPQLLFVSWIGVLAFSLQIYFDFSGYSDMAVGLGRILGLSIPFNFNSPYKATSIIEFWRRWHITLSRFLRDYVYIPIGGNRNGVALRYFNIALVMVLGGLWHGAGWMFLLWGAIHAFGIVINHIWRNWRKSISSSPIRGEKAFSWVLTSGVVMFSWIFFRADDVTTAQNIILGMFGYGDVLILPSHYTQYFGKLTSLLQYLGVEFKYTDKTVYLVQLKMYLFIPIGLLIVYILPNTQEYLRIYLDDTKSSASSHKIIAHLPAFLHHVVYQCRWRPNSAWGLICAVVIIWLTLQSNTVKSFVYFEF
ncbi:MAG: MBOAT family protein [Magnetovibrio sp.]|nr:MBOAT family protein [Magnetovibrio sp.]